MAGNEVEPGGTLPMGERNGELRGGTQRRGDAGHDLDRDAGPATGIDLLGGTAEDQGIAALETHDATAVARKPDHQRVDVVLPARRRVAGLADQDAARLS